MNERIRELTKCNDRIRDFFETGPVQKAAIEDFAETIVRECMTICDEVQDKYGQYTFTAGVCKERFMQHFGVEE